MELYWASVILLEGWGRSKIYMNGENMVARSEENKRQYFTINNVQGRELLMTEFEHRTWFLGISEVIKQQE